MMKTPGFGFHIVMSWVDFPEKPISTSIPHSLPGFLEIITFGRICPILVLMPAVTARMNWFSADIIIIGGRMRFHTAN